MIIYRNFVCIGKDCIEDDEGDELCTDSFPMTVFQDVLYRFQFQNRTDKTGQVDTGGNPSAEDGGGNEDYDEAGESGINCVLNHKLQELEGYTKKDFKNWFKTYSKELHKLVKKNYPDNEEGEAESKAHMKKIEGAMGKVLKDWDNCSFYTGKSFNQVGTLMIIRWEDIDINGKTVNTPFGYLVKDGVFHEKA